MTSLIGWIVWLAPLIVGSAVTARARRKERRWSAVGALVLSLAGVCVLAVSTQWGARPSHLGLLAANGLVATVGPAMLVGSLALVLLAGRKEASGHEYPWLLSIIAAESVAVASSVFGLTVLAELVAVLLLAEHARRSGHRAHLVYLAVSAALLAVAGVLWLLGGGVITPLIAVLTLIGALIRLGVFPFATGMLASLQHGTTTATLLGALPFGAVPLLLQVRDAVPMVDTVSFALLVMAPLAAALAVSQRELSRSLGFTFSALYALIVVGALDPTAEAQLGGELLWAGALLTSCGFGAAANLVTLRLGEVDVSRHHGLHTNAPFLSLAFLVLGVGVAGAPGTVEFVAEDVLLNTASSEGLLGMALVVATLALIGFNVLRLHFRIFFGVRAQSHAYLGIKGRERLGLAMVAIAVILGGVVPGLLPLLATASGH